MDWIFFFDILLYYFNNVMIKTFYIGNFIIVYVIYFTRSLYCYVLLFFPSLEKLHFFYKKSIFSHSFWPRWLKQISFYRELNALHPRIFFFVFHLFPLKKNTKHRNIYIKTRKVRKFFFNIFLNWIFHKFKKHQLWSSGPRLGKWNTIINFHLCEIVEDRFSAGLFKSLYFLCKSFSLYFTKKSLETNYV